MSRETVRDLVIMRMATTMAELSTCARRKVGCILVDHKSRILSTGHNGVPQNVPHCIDKPCIGVDYPSGTGLEACQAVHAEANALLQCPRPDSIWKCYTTTFPCIHCIKLLLNTGCTRIVYREMYADRSGFALWNSMGREVHQLP